MQDVFAEYRRFRALREDVERQARDLKKQEDVLKAQIIAHMRSHCITDAHNVKLKKSTKLVVTDWDPLYTYIKENDAFDLLQKRLTEGAAKLRLADGIALPISEEDDYTLEITKEPQ